VQGLTCKCGSSCQSGRLLIPRLSVRFHLKTFEPSNSHGFEIHRPSIKGSKLLLKVIQTIIIITGVLINPSDRFSEENRIHICSVNKTFILDVLATGVDMFFRDLNYPEWNLELSIP